MSSITWIIKQGSTFRRGVEYVDASDLPVDLTQYQARMQVRPSVNSDTILFNLTTTASADGTGINMTPTSASVVLPASSGSMRVTISAYSSSLVNFDTAYFDYEIYSGSGVSMVVERLFDGKMKMIKNVTR